MNEERPTHIRLLENQGTQACPSPMEGGGRWAPASHPPYHPLTQAGKRLWRRPTHPQTSHPHGRRGGGVGHPPTQNFQNTHPLPRRRNAKHIPDQHTQPSIVSASNNMLRGGGRGGRGGGEEIGRNSPITHTALGHQGWGYHPNPNPGTPTFGRDGRVGNVSLALRFGEQGLGNEETHTWGHWAVAGLQGRTRRSQGKPCAQPRTVPWMCSKPGALYP